MDFILTGNKNGGVLKTRAAPLYIHLKYPHPLPCDYAIGDPFHIHITFCISFSPYRVKLEQNYTMICINNKDTVKVSVRYISDLLVS